MSNLEKSSKNFDLLGSKIKIEFLYDNLRPVARRSIVKNLVVSIIHGHYGLTVSRICRSISYHRNSYYGVKKKFEEKLLQSEESISDKIVESYDLLEFLDSRSCSKDQSSIVKMFNDIVDRLSIDDATKSQL